MHKIISNYLKTYCEEIFVDSSLSEDKRFELFSNYCVIKSFYPEEIDAGTITSDEDDSGIDGICFIIDGEVATTIAEAENILKRPKRNMPVDIYFIQSKTSDSYDRGEILKFGDGVCDFVSDTPQLPQGDFIKEQKAVFDLLVDNVSKITNGRPNAYLKYVCTSNNPVATEIEATRTNIIQNVNATGFFNHVDFDLSKVLLTGTTGFLGVHILKELFDEKTTKKIYCLIRRKNNKNAVERIHSTLENYFSDDIAKKMFEKIEIIIFFSIRPHQLTITTAEKLKLHIVHIISVAVLVIACVSSALITVAKAGKTSVSRRCYAIVITVPRKRACSVCVCSG